MTQYFKIFWAIQTVWISMPYYRHREKTKSVENLYLMISNDKYIMLHLRLILLKFLRIDRYWKRLFNVKALVCSL